MFIRYHCTACERHISLINLIINEQKFNNNYEMINLGERNDINLHLA